LGKCTSPFGTAAILYNPTQRVIRFSSLLFLINIDRPSRKLFCPPCRLASLFHLGVQTSLAGPGNAPIDNVWGGRRGRSILTTTNNHFPSIPAAGCVPPVNKAGVIEHEASRRFEGPWATTYRQRMTLNRAWRMPCGLPVCGYGVRLCSTRSRRSLSQARQRTWVHHSEPPTTALLPDVLALAS